MSSSLKGTRHIRHLSVVCNGYGNVDDGYINILRPNSQSVEKKDKIIKENRKARKRKGPLSNHVISVSVNVVVRVFLCVKRYN